MRVLLALCASAALGVAVSASGCGGAYQPAEPGNSKGVQAQTTAATGKPATPTATTMSQSTGPPSAMPFTPPRIDAGIEVDTTNQ